MYFTRLHLLLVLKMFWKISHSDADLGMLLKNQGMRQLQAQSHLVWTGHMPLPPGIPRTPDLFFIDVTYSLAADLQVCRVEWKLETVRSGCVRDAQQAQQFQLCPMATREAQGGV